MKATDKTIVLGVGLLALVAAFYLLVLAPKREKAAELATEITNLQSSISEQEQVASFAEQARQDFPRYYSRLVVLGKAVPAQADTASLLVELNSIAASSDVDFRGIALGDAAAGSGTASSSTTSPAPAAAPAAAGSSGAAAGTTPSATGSAPASSGESTTTSTTTTADSTATTPPSTSATSPTATATPAPATEASAATLPIGATVGAAGLPTMPYELTFTGGFFGIADYIGGLDRLVQMRDRGGQVAANGRLVTVDGFSLEAGGLGPNPVLDANFSVTTYVTPSEQGLTGGATPGGPAPATQPAATTASTVTR